MTIFLQLNHAKVAVNLDRVDRIEPSGQSTMVRIGKDMFRIHRTYNEVMRLLATNRVAVLDTGTEDTEAPVTRGKIGPSDIDGGQP
jgi:hypothetical protein